MRRLLACLAVLATLAVALSGAAAAPAPTSRSVASAFLAAIDRHDTRGACASMLAAQQDRVSRSLYGRLPRGRTRRPTLP